MPSRLRLYNYPGSGNCLKVRILLAQLGIDYERVEVDIFGGGTLTDAYAEVNPARQTPVLELDGARLPESNAILWYLAEGTPYLPADPLERASIVRWLLFEQTQIGQLAELRLRLKAGLTEPDSPLAARFRSGVRRALATLEQHLTGRTFLVGECYTIADLANYAYVHLAPEVGLDRSDFPALAAWIERVEAQPNFVNDLSPLPEKPIGCGLSIYG